MKLLIISHTPHYLDNGQIVGWGSTVREIDHLATLFTVVEHLAPLHPGPAPASALGYTHSNIRLNPVKPAGGEGVRDKLGVLRRIPLWLRKLRKAVRAADVLHIRCPAGISLVALISARVWGKGKPCWVKYAGNWQPDGKEPLIYRLQRWLLQKNLHRGVVTINGIWPNQREHIYTFNNPSMTHNECAKALEFSRHKSLTLPIHLLFVGRLEQPKGVERLLKIADEIKKQKIDFNLTLIGDGPQRQQYETWVETNQLSDRVHFTGWLPFSALRQHYQQAHLLVLPSSASEGWPKVLSEAMAHGVVPISSSISSIPGILARVGAGKTIQYDDLQGFVDAIRYYLNNPGEWAVERTKSAQAGIEYTYQTYLNAVRNMFKKAWQIELSYE